MSNRVFTWRRKSDGAYHPATFRDAGDALAFGPAWGAPAELVAVSKDEHARNTEARRAS
jgi:hypothetical protein